MTEPKKPSPAQAAPPAPAANAPAAATPAKTLRKPATLAEIQEVADRMRREDAASAPQRAEAAQKGAQMEIEHFAHRAIQWKEVRGVYPWEEPESDKDKAIRTQQEEWLRRSGIDPEKGAAEFLKKVQDAVRRIEAEKKTDPSRGR